MCFEQRAGAGVGAHPMAVFWFFFCLFVTDGEDVLARLASD